METLDHEMCHAIAAFATGGRVEALGVSRAGYEGEVRHTGRPLFSSIAPYVLPLACIGATGIVAISAERYRPWVIGLYGTTFLFYFARLVRDLQDTLRLSYELSDIKHHRVLSILVIAATNAILCGIMLSIVFRISTPRSFLAASGSDAIVISREIARLGWTISQEVLRCL
ncbi:MAG: M50 family metallopeptidase [Candidatus Hydrogenedentota bacterium]